jgi:hypothetical protein
MRPRNAKEQLRADLRETYQVLETDDADRLASLLARSKAHEQMVDARMVEQHDRTPLERAAALGAVGCLRVMLGKAAPHNKACGDAFRQAVLSGHREAADVLIAELDERLADERITTKQHDHYLARGVAAAAGRATNRARVVGHSLALEPEVRRAMQAEPSLQEALELLDQCVAPIVVPRVAPPAPTSGHGAPIAGPTIRVISR